MLRKKRNQHGMTALDTGVTVFLSVVILALVSDLVLLMWGYSINDKAARDGARAAASTGSEDSGWAAAQTAIAAHRTSSFLMQGPTCDKAVPGDFKFVPTPIDGSPGYVTVTTHTQVTGPFTLQSVGGSFKFGNMLFQRTYTFPTLGGSTSNSALDGPFKKAGGGRGTIPPRPGNG